MFNVDNTMYDPDIIEYQDQQQRQVAGCRAFYTEVEELHDFDVLDQEEVVTEIIVTDQNLSALASWLRQAVTWFAFKPAVVEEDGVLKVVF